MWVIKQDLKRVMNHFVVSMATDDEHGKKGEGR